MPAGLARPSAASAAWLAEEPWHKREMVVADTAEVAASPLGGKPLAAPPVEAEEPLQPQGSHSRGAEPPAELLAVGLGAAIGEPQRYLYILQAGEAGAEPVLAVRCVGA